MTGIPPVEVPTQPKATKVAVNIISLPAELAMASLGGVIAGLGTFVGVNVASAINDPKALESAGISAGFVALTFFANSLRNWFQQKYGTPVE